MSSPHTETGSFGLLLEKFKAQLCQSAARIEIFSRFVSLALCLPEAEEMAEREVHYSASCCSPQGRQRDLRSDQDYKIIALWQRVTSRTSNHTCRNEKANFFLFGLCNLLFASSINSSAGNLKLIPQRLQNTLSFEQFDHFKLQLSLI